MGDHIPSAKSVNAQKHRKNSQFRQINKAHSKTAPKDRANANSERVSQIKQSSKLPSNWEKYDQPLETETLGSSSLDIDFNTLTMLSSTAGNQFQLKENKAFLPTSESKLNIGDFFKLDLNCINICLATIPLYNRIRIDKESLSENEIKYMDKSAEDAKNVYNDYVKSRLEKSTKDSPSLATQNNLDNDLDDNCPLTISKDDETAELEDWLDELL